jgi:hypothetical protein
LARGCIKDALAETNRDRDKAFGNTENGLCQTGGPLQSGRLEVSLRYPVLDLGRLNSLELDLSASTGVLIE